MNQLSNKQHWDDMHKSSHPSKFKFQSYCQQYLINLCKKYIPSNPEFKFIEIGCAPGQNIIDFHNAFEFQPYGVEYSPNGYYQTIKTFGDNGYNVNHVIPSDFLNQTFQREYNEFFDVVASFGLVEHFKSPREAIRNHINIVKRDCYLIITIPNLKGLNKKTMEYFNNDIIDMCNIDIMNINVFKSLFDTEQLETLYCGYYGIFSFGLFNTKPESRKRHLLNLCYGLQFGMDRIFERTSLNTNIQGSNSPYLVYIGKKK